MYRKPWLKPYGPNNSKFLPASLWEWRSILLDNGLSSEISSGCKRLQYAWMYDFFVAGPQPMTAVCLPIP